MLPTPARLLKNGHFLTLLLASSVGAAGARELI
jgi:hypothetical protein